MLYDLNIPWSAGLPPAELERTLKFAKFLGYDVVALNHTVAEPVPKEITNPIPVVEQPSPAPPLLPLPSQQQQKQQKQQQQQQRQQQQKQQQPLSPNLLRRATIHVTDLTANHRLPDFTRHFDLVAIRPLTEKAFTWACTSQDTSSLISLDLGSPMGYYFPHRTCMAAVSRGIRFEVCYGQALPPGNMSIDEGERGRIRACFIGNLKGLIRATKGRGVLVSSGGWKGDTLGSNGGLGLRGPADVVNLLAVWGMGPEKGTEAMREVPRVLLANERLRRTGFRGVIDIIQVAKGEAREGQQSKKRVRVDNDGGVGSDDAPNQTTTLSKRQAKKQKKAAATAVAAEAETSRAAAG